MSQYSFMLSNMSYEQHNVIDDCSFHLDAGQTAAFVGPSGCGKTTLLNTIAGIAHFPNAQVPEQLKKGYIFQEARLIPWLTVAENLTLVKPELDEQDITHALEHMKLSDVATQYPAALSGGMQKRVSIARCFVSQPELVLLDEPFSSLDAPTAQHLISWVNELLLDSQSAAILVTHQLIEALQLADVIYFLSNKPTKIIKTWFNPLRQNKSIDEKKRLIADHLLLENTARALLNMHPDLLSGRLAE